MLYVLSNRVKSYDNPTKRRAEIAMTKLKLVL